LSDPKIRAKGNYEGACPATGNNHEERRLHRIGDTTFEAFDNFSDFVESVTCETSKICQVRGSNPCRGAKLLPYEPDLPNR
jgi:hypothetical protein